MREQGIDDNETLLLRRKFFYSDQNVDSRDPVQLNLLYVQVPFAAPLPGLLPSLWGLAQDGLARLHAKEAAQGGPALPGRSSAEGPC